MRAGARASSHLRHVRLPASTAAMGTQRAQNGAEGSDVSANARLDINRLLGFLERSASSETSGERGCATVPRLSPAGCGCVSDRSEFAFLAVQRA
jgi:hypothetical protein